MQHDAVVVGGAFAGLAAATYLARARRSVCVIDARRPRNRFANASHGFLGFDGSDPRSILAKARDQLAAYPTARLIEGEAIAARCDGDGFSVTLSGGGEAMSARKLILAFGLRDQLERIPGLAERWGRTVLHCPYCHGFEFSGRSLGVLYRAPMSVHQACLVAEWGPTTLFLNGAELDPGSAAALAGRGVAVEPGTLSRLVGEGHALSAVAFEDGRERPVEALYVAPRSCLSSPIAEQLGAAIDEGPLGPMIRTDADRMTTVPGLYAAGDIARAPHSVSWAVADGVTAGTSAHRALVFG
ncbi:NAD(P)/FAD-dependent oxidoreductase [Azospirillum sp. RWY-5-1]|uniref:Thioredoxin reductase n=1 Tax=Azospirillum oleiclasticum TaxID=2735135 RepID=A0ABX2TCX5_9PROT|nr:NAD(P)/FAD-dependent oxidoreductase [Azospirillum oleiclasticum]NYZ15781.1 NAD(P)/FAD-dependent oxidoreductase [Azospirillum oleiclasticum]NYZ22051.1 NAD(P)/FAD-dependent oxidoreductase [Azospirillum oleiclasticum]